MKRKIIIHIILFCLYLALYFYLIFYFTDFFNINIVLIIGSIYVIIFLLYICYSVFLCIRHKSFYTYTYIFCTVLILFVISHINVQFKQDFGNSIRIFDRNNILIYAKGENTPIFKLQSIPSFLHDSLIFLEDKRFYMHGGYDILAIARALFDNIFYNKITGASTITQQTIKNLYYKKLPRNYFTKLIEIYASIIFEIKYSKGDILKTYLDYIPFGPNIIGISDAAYFYFSVSVENLSPSQMLTLLTIPNATTKYNPYISSIKLVNRKNLLAKKMYDKKIINDRLYFEIVNENVFFQNVKNINKIPHFTFFILNNLSKYGINFENKHIDIFTTVDLYINEEINKIAKKNILFLKDFNVNNASVVVIDNGTNEVLNYIGSVDYFNDEIKGKVNIINSYRQVGSTLKPFIFAFAFLQGLSPKDLVNDDKKWFIAKNNLIFRPKNYDLKYHGIITLEEALGNSLNIPAVQVLDYVKVDKLLSMFKAIGIDYISEDKDFYGLSLALGSAEMKLIDMTNMYSMLANKGIFNDYKFIKKIIDRSNNQDLYKKFDINKSIKIFDEIIAMTITHILATDTNRRLQFGMDSYLKTTYPTSVKTGTTRGYRDNLIFGYNKYITVGIWVGNADTKKMIGISGVTGAGPIYWDIMENIYKNKINLYENKEYFNLASKMYNNFLNKKKNNFFETEKLYIDKPYVYSPENMAVYKINYFKPIDTQKILFYVKNTKNQNSDIKWNIYNKITKSNMSVFGNNKLVFLDKGNYSIDVLLNESLIDKISIKVE